MNVIIWEPSLKKENRIFKTRLPVLMGTMEDELEIYPKTERKGQYIPVPDSSVRAISALASIQIGG